MTPKATKSSREQFHCNIFLFSQYLRKINCDADVRFMAYTVPNKDYTAVHSPVCLLDCPI